MNECIPIEELGRVAALPPGDPGRAHLEHCLRCRSLADLLFEFATPSSSSHEAGFAQADARLREQIETLTGVSATPAAATVPGRLARQRAVPAVPWWSRFRGPQLAGAFAALVVLGAAGTVLWRAHGPAQVMRSGPASAASAFVSEVVREDSGAVVLGWTALPRASAYRVVLLDESLRVIVRMTPVHGTTVSLVASALPAGLAHGASIAWEVEALQAGDVIAVSPPGPLRLP